MRFAAAILTMTALLCAGLAFGQPFSAAALLYITVFTFFMDKIVALAAPDAPGEEFPSGTSLSITLGITQFPILFWAVAVLSADGAGTTVDKILIFIAVSLYVGQVGNANAHELIHRAGRFERRLGAAVYGSILFGHHASAHLRVHHVSAATPDDPNSARLGEHFYAYALRAWIGSFKAGLAAESRMRAGKGGMHPYWGYGAVSAVSVATALMIGGADGVLWYLAIAFYAQAQLLLSDYVQHYGLERQRDPDGGWMPIGPAHSWNAPHGFSSALMLNAPRHSDHHARPSRAYPGLALDRDSMPLLPQSLPVMAVLALVPPVWHRLMDHRAQRLQARAQHIQPVAAQ